MYDVRDRQTSDRCQTSDRQTLDAHRRLIPLPYGRGHIVAASHTACFSHVRYGVCGGVYIGGEAVGDAITCSAARCRLVVGSRRQRVRSSVPGGAALHPRRTAAELRRLSEPADRALADEAATVFFFFLFFFFAVILFGLAVPICRAQNFPTWTRITTPVIRRVVLPSAFR